MPKRSLPYSKRNAGEQGVQQGRGRRESICDTGRYDLRQETGVFIRRSVRVHIGAIEGVPDNHRYAWNNQIGEENKQVEVGYSERSNCLLIIASC